MTATIRQNEEFAEKTLAPMLSDALDAAIEWVSENMSPEDVFEAHLLKTWAKDNGFVEAEE